VNRVTSVKQEKQGQGLLGSRKKIILRSVAQEPEGLKGKLEGRKNESAG